MPSVVTFQDLIASFSEASVEPSALVADAAAAATRGVVLDPTAPQFFVPADLIAEDPESPSPTFLLISAPAAVGKSILAEALAFNLRQRGRQILYVPLRGSTIGDNFFAGLVGSVFPGSGKDEVMESIRVGRTVILFDGYDELSMTAEQSRMNERFIEEVKDELAPEKRMGDTTSPSVIFLYRSAIQSLGIFNVILEHSQKLDLQYFSPPQQAEFLAGYTIWRRPSRSGPPAAYRDLLSALKQHLAAADDESAQTFFGHAPVLMALGDLVLEEESGNVMRIAQELMREDFRANRAVELVKRIIRQLLEREVPKFPREMFATKGVGSFEPYPVQLQSELLNRVITARVEGTNWEEIIRPYITEECGRRLAADPGTKQLAGADRRWLEETYAQEMLRKFEQHPFIDTKEDEIRFSNPIYAEKYLAEYLLQVSDHDLPRVFAAFPAPSYYLAQFVLDGLPERDLNGRQGLTFYVLRSLSMASGDAFEARFVWSQNRWEVTVETGKLVTEPFWCSDELLVLTVPDRQILENVIVDAPGSAMVAIEVLQGDSHKRRVTLSQVSLLASMIEIVATHLTCNAVRLSAEEIRLDDALQSIDGIDSLTVTDGIRTSNFIRRKYGDALVPADGEDEAAFLQKNLNKILTWFRKRGAKNYAVYDKRFNTVVLSKGQDRDAAAVADFLWHERILRDEEQMVVLDQDRLAQYGIYYAKQNQLNFDEGFEDLVTNWIAYSE